MENTNLSSKSLKCAAVIAPVFVVIVNLPARNSELFCYHNIREDLIDLIGETNLHLCARHSSSTELNQIVIQISKLHQADCFLM